MVDVPSVPGFSSMLSLECDLPICSKIPIVLYVPENVVGPSRITIIGIQTGNLIQTTLGRADPDVPRVSRPASAPRTYTNSLRSSLATFEHRTAIDLSEQADILLVS